MGLRQSRLSAYRARNPASLAERLADRLSCRPAPRDASDKLPLARCGIGKRDQPAERQASAGISASRARSGSGSDGERREHKPPRRAAVGNLARQDFLHVALEIVELALAGRSRVPPAIFDRVRLVGGAELRGREQRVAVL
jgi:hypothetical protein